MIRSFAVLLAVLAVLPQRARAQAAADPNIVIIMADDLGYGDLSCYGGWIETPHLDSLARNGLRFTDFHSSGNVCSPTRAGLMTGRYQQRAGIPGVILADPQRPVHYDGLQLSEYTLAESLRQAGYATALFGKWHLGYEREYNPLHHGFDLFRGYVSGNVDFFTHIDQAGQFDWWVQDRLEQEEGYTTHLITEHAVRFIEEHRERPFFLYLPHEAPHYPYQGPQDPPVRLPNSQVQRDAERTDIKNAYREMVQEMDLGIGRVVETLERCRLADRTLIWFFSDNGANRNGSNGPLRGTKGTNWEGGHRVPSIASWPGRVPAGATTAALSITLDVMPTVIFLSGAYVPGGIQFDGQDLSEVLLEGKSAGSRQLFWNGQAMRDGPWKLILESRGAQQVGLYQLEQDPGEQTNLAEQHPERVARMLAALEDWKRSVARGAALQPSQP